MDPRIQKAIAEAVAQQERIARRLAARSGPPAPGDIYLTNDGEVLVVRSHPDQDDLYLLVPVDDELIEEPVVDLLLASDRPLVARCNRAFWSAIAHPQPRVDVLDLAAVKPIRQLFANLARGLI